MLSTTHRFLFIHVPKTAGNAIQDVLRDYADDRIVCIAPHQDGMERFEVRSDRYDTRKHSNLAAYSREYGTEMMAGLFKFSCVRNPWDRAISFWFSPHRTVSEWDPAGFGEFVHTIPTLSHYLGSSPAQPLRDAVRNVDLLIRYEELQQGFSQACSRIGIPSRPLHIRNKGSRQHYRTYYDASLRKLVGERFREEIELFDYAF